jgi:hypothetical protein
MGNDEWGIEIIDERDFQSHISNLTSPISNLSFAGESSSERMTGIKQFRIPHSTLKIG